MLRGALRSSAGVGVVMLLAALAQFAAMVILGRVLSAEALGSFSLVLSLASVVSAFALLGQSNAFARILARGDPTELAWRPTVGRALAESIAMAVVFGIVAGIGFGVGTSATIVLVAAAAGLAVSELIGAGMLRPFGRFFGAALLLRYWSLILGIAIGVLYLGHALELESALVTLGIVGGAGVIIGPLALLRLKSGTSEFPSSWRRTGMMFWVIQLCLIGTRHLDRLVLGSVLGTEALGQYQAVLTLAMMFDLASTALGFVLLPKLAKREGVDFITLGGAVGGVAALGAVGYLVLGEPILSLLYEGRFDAYAGLIPWFVGAGVIKIVYALPSALLGGRTVDRGLAWFAWLNVPLVLIHGGLTAYFASRYGPTGAAIALVVAWLLRLIVSSVLVKTFWRR